VSPCSPDRLPPQVRAVQFERRDPLQVRKATLTAVVAKAGAGIRFNEHLDFDDGEAVFRQRLQDGPRRRRVETPRLALSIRAVARLAQVQEPEGAGSQA
jgi:hypothetical protein